jgi:hypothetical protein
MNTDHAVHILMAENFRIPADLYYWGQERLGSFVPFFAHVLYKLFFSKTITAVAAVQFSLLLLSFLILAGHLKKYINKLALCMVMFIPLPSLLVYVYIGHPYVAQFFIFCSILYCHFLLVRNPGYTSLQRWLLVISSTFLGIVAIWVSEVSVVFIFCYSICLAASLLFKGKIPGVTIEKRALTFKRSLFYTSAVLLAGALGLAFLYYAKTNAARQEGFSTWFVNFPTFTKSVNDFISAYLKSLQYQTSDFYICTHNIVMSVVLLFILFISVKRIITRKSRFLFLPGLFFLNAFFSFFFLLSSNWVASNDYDLRYFIYSYLFLAFFVIFYIDSISEGPLRFSSLLLIMVFILTSYRSWEHQNINYKGDVRNFSLKKVNSFSSLRGGGIIGDYWFSYILAINSEFNIVATPHDRSFVRKPELIDSVFKRKDIYIVQNFWLTTFPDTIYQFERALKCNGVPQNICGVILCKYKLVKLKRNFGPQEMKTNGLTMRDAVSQKPMYFASDTNKVYKNEYFVFGPFTRLYKGNYKIHFLLGDIKALSPGSSITLDVSENWGTSVLSSKRIALPDTTFQNKMQSISLDLYTKENRRDVEFRININGRVDITFYNVLVEQL